MTSQQGDLQIEQGNPLNQLLITMNMLVQQLSQQSQISQQTSNNASTSANEPRPAREILLSKIDFSPFDESMDTFEHYVQRLENFFNMKQLIGLSPEVDKAKVQILINSIGSKPYQLLTSLTAPELPATKSYMELITHLKSHLCPKPNILTEQHRFLSRIQQPGESISKFIAALKHLSTNCSWNCPEDNCQKSILSVILRAQFIRGIRDDDIREKLLQQGGEVSFEKAFEIAVAIETSKSENRELYKSSTINQISHSQSRHSRQKQRTDSCKRNSKGTFRNKSQDRGKMLHELGISGLCLHCGRNNHKSKECRVIHKLKCQNCSKKGHVPKVCISSLLKTKDVKSNVQFIDPNPSPTDSLENDIQDNFIVNVFHESSIDEKKIIANIEIQGKRYPFECDSGSSVSIISFEKLKDIISNPQLQKTNVTFRTFTGEYFKPLGYIQLPVKYNNISSNENLYVVKGSSPTILGRRWLRNLEINLNDINLINGVEQNKTVPKSNIVSEYSELFTSQVGKIPNYECSLKLRNGAKPIFVKPRVVPYAMKEKVEMELVRMEKEGLIEKLEHSEWGTPIVAVPKQDGVRICADYKVTVNPQLHDSRYPIPKIEDILNKLKGGKYFCTLDLYKAYLHIPVEEETAKIQAITTHLGTYKVNRLNFGIKTAPNEFHKIIDQVVQNLEGTVAYFDDILIQGSTLEQCQYRLEKCLERLRQYNFHLNPGKCKFFQQRVSYLGYTITQNGLEKSKEKVQAILDAPRPQTTEEVRKFLGMVNYIQSLLTKLLSCSIH